MEDQDQLKQVIEALIFASDQPVSARVIGSIIEGTTPKRVEQTIALLNQDYRDTGRVFEIVPVGGGFHYITRSQFHPWLKLLFRGRRKQRLTRPALETLAIVAYRQPVTKTTVESIRGVNIDGVMQTLLERKLITIAGREKSPGRPLLYKTTSDFLQYFGINDLDDLPNLREIEEIFDTSEVPTVNEIEPIPGDNGDSGPQEVRDTGESGEGDGQ